MSRACPHVVKEFAEAWARLQDLKAEETEAKARIDELMPLVEQHFIETGTQRTTIDSSAGPLTVHTRETMLAWAKDREHPEDLLRTLDNMGYGEIAKRRVNAQTLAGLCRDLINELGELPKELNDVVHLQTKTTITARRSQQSESQTSRAVKALKEQRNEK